MTKDKKDTITTIPPEFDYSYFSPLEVKVGNNFDKALKTFRSLVQAEKILSLYKEKQSYEKPSEKRRRKQNDAIKRAFDVEMKQRKILSGEYEKEKAKKLARKEAKRKERENGNDGQE
jgi:small subunit ribosomal protein S21